MQDHDQGRMADRAPEPCSSSSFVLCELASLDKVFTPIKNATRVKYLCFDVSKRYLAFGASTGDIFMFQRDHPVNYLSTVTNKEGAVTLIALGPDDSIVGVSTSRGHVLILEHNVEKSSLPPQRLQLSYEHKGAVVTGLQWNSAGNRLYVGDDRGKVSVLNASTSKAKSLFQSPPTTLMKLDSKVVQMDFAQDRLLASTLTRCYLGDTVREKFTQVGKKLRDGVFGACFFPGIRCQDPVTIFAARPSSRIWEVDLRANVLNTHQFKEALSIAPTKLATFRLEYNIADTEFEVHPQAVSFIKLFTVWVSNENFPLLFTWSEKGVYIIDPRKAKVVLWNKDIVDIKDVRCLKNEIYIQYSDDRFSKYSLLTLERAVCALYQHELLIQCAQLFIASSQLVTQAILLQYLPAAVVCDLIDRLVEMGRTNLASSVSSLMTSFGISLENRPARKSLCSSDPVHSDSGSYFSSKGVIVQRELKSSPRHARCHSSESIAKYSPPPHRSVKRSPLPSRSHTANISLQDEKPVGAIISSQCDTQSSFSDSSLSPLTVSGLSASSGTSSPSKEEDVIPDNLSDSHAPQQLNLAQNVVDNTDAIYPNTENLNERMNGRSADSEIDNLPADNIEALTANDGTASRNLYLPVNQTSSLVEEYMNNNHVTATDRTNGTVNSSASSTTVYTHRPIPFIPPSPMDSPGSPLDGVDPEVLASMCAEQDVGYESVYQYLNIGLYGAGMFPPGFDLKGFPGADLAQLADLSRFRESITSKFSSSKEILMKNIRGLESRIRQFNVDQTAGVLSPSGMFHPYPETRLETIFSPIDENKPSPSELDMWFFLPPFSSKLSEVTLSTSHQLENPEIVYNKPSLLDVLEKWICVLHGVQREVFSYLCALDLSQIPKEMLQNLCLGSASDETSHKVQKRNRLVSEGELDLSLSSDPSPQQWLQSIFICDPFHLSPEVHEQAQEVLMLCLQMNISLEIDIERNLTRSQESEQLSLQLEQTKKPSFDFCQKDGAPPQQMGIKSHEERMRGSTTSLESEDLSLVCDFSFPKSSPSEKLDGSKLENLPKSAKADSSREVSPASAQSSIAKMCDEQLDAKETISVDFTPEFSPFGYNTGNYTPLEKPSPHRNDHSLSTVSNGSSPDLQSLEQILPSHSTEHLELKDHYSGEMSARECNLSDAPDGEYNQIVSHNTDTSPCSTSLSETYSWMPMKAQPTNSLCTELLKQDEDEDQRLSLIIQYYFHLLDTEKTLEIIQESHASRYQSWCVLVKGMQLKLGKEMGKDAEFIVQKIDGSGGRIDVLLTYLIMFHSISPSQAEKEFLKRCHQLMPRDILYFTKYVHQFPALFLEAMMQLFTSLSETQTSLAIKKYLHNEEVRWTWIENVLQSMDGIDLKCQCGGPRPGAHKVQFPAASYFLSVLENSEWSSRRYLNLCQSYGFWSGYLYILKKENHHFEHLVTVLQLGDTDLFCSQHKLSCCPETKDEWKRTMELVLKQNASADSINCLFCGEEFKSLSTTITLEVVARRLLEVQGPQEAINILQSIDLPRGALSPHFYFSSILVTLINQQQSALTHRMLSRLESYLWSRKPTTIPPQAVDILDKEKRGLANQEDLNGIQIHSKFLEEPESQWGITSSFQSNCSSCQHPLTSFAEPSKISVCLCGHAFHGYCLQGEICITCIDQTTG